MTKIDEIRARCDAEMPEKITKQYVAQCRSDCKRLLKDHNRLTAQVEALETELAGYREAEIIKPVRCGECRLKNKQLCRAAVRTKYNLKTEKWTYKTLMEDDGFCSRGEPKEEGSAEG